MSTIQKLEQCLCTFLHLNLLYCKNFVRNLLQVALLHHSNSCFCIKWLNKNHLWHLVSMLINVESGLILEICPIDLHQSMLCQLHRLDKPKFRVATDQYLS